VQVLALAPNCDAGSGAVLDVLRRHESGSRLLTIAHLPREQFVSWMAAVDFMIGNSSAGIIEAASFGTPVVNVGARQQYRERNANVVDAGCDPHSLGAAIDGALAHGRYLPENIYGDGAAGRRILEFLGSVSLDRALLDKSNVY
jgi:GDP/UDP-N,N'-diacetylbacillosamine 2-epimerase (hydrolysing)